MGTETQIVMENGEVKLVEVKIQRVSGFPTFKKTVLRKNLTDREVRNYQRQGVPVK